MKLVAERCPSCGGADRTIVPDRFRARGPFCDDLWHQGPLCCRWCNLDGECSGCCFTMPHIGGIAQGDT